MFDKLIEHIVKECNAGRHKFTKWYTVEEGHKRHCTHCGHEEVITEEDIARTRPDDVSYSQLD